MMVLCANAIHSWIYTYSWTYFSSAIRISARISIACVWSTFWAHWVRTTSYGVTGLPNWKLIQIMKLNENNFKIDRKNMKKWRIFFTSTALNRIAKPTTARNPNFIFIINYFHTLKNFCLSNENADWEWT